MASKKSYLKVYNKTDLNVSVKVSEVDNYDWDGNSRPDHNFNDISINAHTYRKEREEVNSFSNGAWFRMHLKFSNGDEINFRNDYNTPQKLDQRLSL